jgi:hypothetical protein
MRNDPNATVVYLRWSQALNDWVTCDATDKGAIGFTRPSPPEPRRHAEDRCNYRQPPGPCVYPGCICFHDHTGAS